MQRIQQTIANSGSRLGSTPNSKLFAPEPVATGPSPSPVSSSGILLLRSADNMGEDIRASDNKCAPGGTERICLSGTVRKT